MQTVQINLKNGKTFLLDAADEPAIKKLRLWSDNRNYVRVHLDHGRSTYLHRWLLNPKPGEIVDHINGRTNDNRRANLRITNRVGNAHNCHRKSRAISGFWCVKHDPRGHKTWQVCLTCRRERVHCGYYKSRIVAALISDTQREKIYGRYFPRNFPHILEQKRLRDFVVHLNGRIFKIVFVCRHTRRELSPPEQLRLKRDLLQYEKNKRVAEQNAETNERVRHIKSLMESFREVPRTEGAFYLQFKAMPMVDVEYLESVWQCHSDWQVFATICKYFNVNLEPRGRRHRSDRIDQKRSCTGRPGERGDQRRA